MNQLFSGFSSATSASVESSKTLCESGFQCEKPVRCSMTTSPVWLMCDFSPLSLWQNICTERKSQTLNPVESSTFEGNIFDFDKFTASATGLKF